MAARLLELADEMRAEGVAVGTSELLDAFEALETRGLDLPGGLPRGARGDAGQVAGGPARARRAVRPLLLPRGGARGRGARAHRGALHRRRGHRPRGAPRADPRRDPSRLGRRDARPGAAGDRGVRPPGRGLRRDRGGRAADPPQPRPARRAPAAGRHGAAGPRRRAAREPPAVRGSTCAASSSGC